jgi:serine/threonine-protein kinase
LKPANIFFHEVEGQERVVKVLDFGIAMAVSPEWSEENRKRLTETGLVTGTAEYMAPEQAQGSTKFTAAIDVYALGCLGYQLLTGRFPFSGSNAVEIAIKHIYEPVPELSAEVMETRVGAVILKALHKDPEVRYADAGSMLAALRAPVGGQSAALSAVDTGPATAASVPGLAMADTGPDIAAADTAPGGATAVDDVEASRTLVQPMVSEIPRPRPMIWIFGGLAVGSLLVSVGVWVVVSSGKTAAPDLPPGTMEVPSVTVAVEETPAPIEEAPNGDGVVAAEPDASAAPEDLSLKVPAEEPGEGANSGTPRVGSRRRGGRGRSQPRAAGGKEGATGDRLNPTPADVPTKDRAVEKPEGAGSGGGDAEAAQDKKKSGSAEGSGEGGGKAAAPVESKGAEEKVTAKALEERAAEAGGKEERPSEAPVKKEEEVPHGF